MLICDLWLQEVRATLARTGAHWHADREEADSFSGSVYQRLQRLRRRQDKPNPVRHDEFFPEQSLGCGLA